jgi:hypothetical protein
MGLKQWGHLAESSARDWFRSIAGRKFTKRWFDNKQRISRSPDVDQRTAADRHPVADWNSEENGAGYEIRTRDIQLGKLTLYQLS